ncbi:putative chitobiose transport system substrate-binding protein [Pseudoduganella flava]|uniref:Extracellular solute-binding protein n=1 Tax=Pseudoduganella flava TaxID=871742 RepID=A0A562Q4H3_9BURK|nr:extracellular solute-binding protein [Pseudoduganella flava]QGZ41638.1 extracellular solute-binding protein [Pseudoduganella flava]TWI51628.1 putative chitobiose transport system substrate-binding protein [Pseudoduganella flava]
MKLARLLPALAFVMAGCAAAAAPVKLEFWTFSMKPKFTPYFDGVVRRYEAANPGVRVEWIDFPWDVIQTKLVTRIVAGTPPALVNLNVPWADEFARDGLLQPVDALLGADRPRYLDSALADLTFGGKTYGFPLYSNVAVIAYNKDIFKAAGIPHAPRSLDEQLAFARQIAQRTGKAGLCPALAKIDGLMMQQGLPVIRNGRAVFNSPAHVALIRKLADTYKAGGLLKDSLFAEDNFPAAIDAYKGGRLGMLLAPPTAVKRIELDAKDVYAVTDVAPAPLGPTKIADGGWLIHFGVPAGVPKALLPEVGKFARFLTNDANQLAFAKQASVYPAAAQASRDPFFLAVPPGAGAAEKAVAAGAVSMPYSRTMYVAGVTDYDELRRSLVKAVEAGVTGRQDIQQALDAAVAIWNRKLAKQFPAEAPQTSAKTNGKEPGSDPSGLTPSFGLGLKNELTALQQ